MKQELSTPKWYSNASKDDFREPILYLKEKLNPSKVYVLGMSLGASVMAHVLTEIEVDGAVLMNTPIIFPNVISQISKAFGGFLNKATGEELNKTIMRHQNNT
jgi:predicted alpha/beta-fold hydrolase